MQHAGQYEDRTPRSPDGGSAIPTASGNLPDQRWFIYPALKGEAQGLAQQVGVSPLLAQVLLNRGVSTVAMAQDFLHPETFLLPSPLDEFPDLEQSVEILVQAIQFQEKIAICGDYDADGMTSTALLLRALRSLGAQVDYAIPSRMQEGYGINRRIVEEFASDGVSIILTVDNGIAAVEPIAYARELGLTVIVTDHHDVPPEIPPAHAILNPKLIAPTSPYFGVAGVGVAYILAICLAQALGKTQDLTAPLLELFTLGTIADLAPLIGVNRRWVRRGLRLLPRSRLTGVQALIAVAGLADNNDSLKPEDIGFRLGPRINAIGRIGDPQVVIDLLTTDDPDVAHERAAQCEQANQHRQDLCSQIELEAIAWVEAQRRTGAVDLERDRVLLIVQPAWHHGVIGIVASRLVERYGVPVFISTYEDEDHKEIRGSARGIPEFHVFDALQSCHDLLTKFGGHQAAGGYSFPAKHLRQVKSRLVNFANQVLRPEHLKPLVTVDVRVPLTDLTAEFLAQFDVLHPCGIQNPDPVFWTPNLRIVEQWAIGQTKTHLKLRVAEDTGSPMEAIAWRWGEFCPLPERVDLAYKLKLNTYQGVSAVQLEVVGVRPATLTGTAVNPRYHQTQVQGKSVKRSPTATVQLPLMSEATVSPLPSEAFVDPAQSMDWASFTYDNRSYQAQILSQGPTRELQIHNAEGQVLMVLLPERKGYRWQPGEAARPVNLTEPGYANLVRAALDTLQLRQKDQLIQEKEDLLAEQERRIVLLTQQVASLQAQLEQRSGAPSPSSPQIRTEASVPLAQLQRQETAGQSPPAKRKARTAAQPTPLQSPETTVATIEQSLPIVSPLLDDKAIEQQAKTAVGNKIWFCLDPASHQDLCGMYKHIALVKGTVRDRTPISYAEAGRRLGRIVAREILQPWLGDLAMFLQEQGISDLGGVVLESATEYPLSLAAPLLANEWVSVRSQALQSTTRPEDGNLYLTVRANKPLNRRDRALLTDFFEQWEHPLRQWFQGDHQTLAGTLDQVSVLHKAAIDQQSPFPDWSFDLMHTCVIGNLKKPGLLQQIFQ